jgi:HNH endonuclease
MPRKQKSFWDRVDKSGNCWLWLDGTNEDGYGTLRFNGKMEKAHRISWMLTHGPIRKGIKICHDCDNPPCVRPSHLFAGTDQDNAKDRHKKGRTKNLELGPLARASITHCPKGHEYTPENTMVRETRSGSCRVCRECGREGTRRYLEKNRDAHNARRRAARAKRRIQ